VKPKVVFFATGWGEGGGETQNGLSRSPHLMTE